MKDQGNDWMEKCMCVLEDNKVCDDWLMQSNDLDPTKICDNCMKCILHRRDHAIEIRRAEGTGGRNLPRAEDLKNEQPPSWGETLFGGLY